MSRKLVQCEPSCSVGTDGRTERRKNMTKVTVAFRTSWNKPSDTNRYLNYRPLEVVVDKY